MFLFQHFIDTELTKVSLDEVKRAAATIDIATHGTKIDIAKRIHKHRKGKRVFKKLIKNVEQKDEAAKDAFVQEERVRLINAGANHKEIDDEVERLWSMHKKTSNVELVSYNASRGPPSYYSFPDKFTFLPLAYAVKRKWSGSQDAPMWNQIVKDEASFAHETMTNFCERLKTKKIKREHIDGILEGFGKDASGWTTDTAKEQLSYHLLNYTSTEEDED